MTLVSRLSGLLIVLLLVGCSQEKVQVIQGSIYGTTYSIQFTENINKEEIHTLVKAELDRIDMVFSTYKPSSEISLINDCRKNWDLRGWDPENAVIPIAIRSYDEIYIAERRIDVKQVKANVLKLLADNPQRNKVVIHAEEISAEEISAVLDGVRGAGIFAIDISLEAYPDFNPIYDEKKEVYKCANSIGSPEFNDLLKRADKFNFITDGAFHAADENSEFFNGLLPWDFSAIGKGYAVDKISELLAENGIVNYFIDIGGELSINGTKFGELWSWGVEKPINSDSGAYRAFKAPQNGISIATSGEYRNPGHIWGIGARDAVSVTVIDDNTTDADAWATAMYVLGIEKGLRVAEKKGVAVFFIRQNGKSVNSSEWSKIYP